MSIADETGQSHSITEVWRALKLFTNRQEIIELFISYLNDDPPRKTILFFYGDGGNGKSLLLRYLRENFCKRFKRENWEWLKSDFHDEEFVEHIKLATENLSPMPFAEIDFGLKTRNAELPQNAFDGLLMLRHQLGTSLISFPLFDFACVWYLYKTNKLTKERLKELFPTEEMDVITAIVNAASGTSYGTITKAIIGIIGKHKKGNFTLKRQMRGLDEIRVTEIQQMDANTDLIEYLPEFFAEDLNTAMTQPKAPERIVLFFDTHESFWGHQRKMPEATYFRQDEWLRRLLCKLDLGKGIIAVVAGRENPNSESKRESKRRWTDATRSNIPEKFVDAYLVGHLPPADADVFLRRAGITDVALRDNLIKYAEVERGEIHPLYLGLLVDIVLAAKRQNIELSAKDFHQQPQTSQKSQELINRLLSYIDLDTRNAVSTLAACRAFDVKIFDLLGKSLNFYSTDAAFEILLSFSFVWQAEQRGIGWYRIHELLRRLFAKNNKPENDQAHRVLEAYYRQRNTDGDELAIAEAIYHANKIDRERSVDEWAMVFERWIRSKRYQLCRALLEVRREMFIDTDFQLGRVSGLEGIFHFELSYYNEAKQVYEEAINAYDRALKLAPNSVSVLNNKGLALIRRGELEAKLTKHDEALQSYQDAIETCNRTLKLAPNSVSTLNNKVFVLKMRGELETMLTKHDEALQSYQNAIEICDRVLKLAPDSVGSLHDKGLVLKRRGELGLIMTKYDEALQSYQDTIETYDQALDLAPNSVSILNNKGVALIRRGELEAMLTKHDEALQSYQDAIVNLDHALELAPDFVSAFNNKGLVLKRRGELRNNLGQISAACEDWSTALKDFSCSLEIAPDDKQIHDIRRKVEDLIYEHCRKK